jgi:two-component system response regulator AdeR
MREAAGDDGAGVVVVEDDADLRSMFVAWLDGRFDVTAAGTGEAALAAVDGDTDVVLLDRALPDTSGRAVLDSLRERDGDPRVAMVTAVEPTTDLAEMPVDDYLVKPVDRQVLGRTVDSLLARGAYADLVDRHFELTAKIGVLERTHGDDVLDADDDYRRLVTEHERVRERLAERRDSLHESGEYDKLFADLSPGA